MLECGLRAVVLHDKGVVWNYYAECTADSRRINTKSQKNTENLGKFVFKTTGKVSDFDSMIENNYRILCGVIGRIGYISFDCNWIRLQFKCTDTDSVYCRTIYGSHTDRTWTKII